MKKFMAAAMAGVMVLSMTSCKKIQEVDPDDFKDAICDQFDIDEDDIVDYEGDDVEDIYYYDLDTDIFLDMYIFEDEDDAKEEFDEWKDEVDDDLSGTHASVTAGNTGYVTFDGEMEDEDVYGGVYRVGNNVYIVYAMTSSNKSHKIVDDILEGFEFPTP